MLDVVDSFFQNAAVAFDERGDALLDPVDQLDDVRGDCGFNSTDGVQRSTDRFHDGRRHVADSIGDPIEEPSIEDRLQRRHRGDHAVVEPAVVLFFFRLRPFCRRAVRHGERSPLAEVEDVALRFVFQWIVFAIGWRRRSAARVALLHDVRQLVGEQLLVVGVRRGLLQVDVRSDRDSLRAGRELLNLVARAEMHAHGRQVGTKRRFEALLMDAVERTSFRLPRVDGQLRSGRLRARGRRDRLRGGRRSRSRGRRLWLGLGDDLRLRGRRGTHNAGSCRPILRNSTARPAVTSSHPIGPRSRLA